MFGLSPVEKALEHLAQAEPEARGAVFTRREVVEFILDLVGYIPDRPLWKMQILEPSCGDGDFLLVLIDRLLDAWKQQTTPVSVNQLLPCIRAVEIHSATFEKIRTNVLQRLKEAGIGHSDSNMLVDCWLVHGDFLLTNFSSNFDFIVGNPPYVRQESIPDALISEYRARYTTVFDRADLYIPFIERSLSLLSDQGKLGIICADRWVKNRYGGPLRQLIAEHFQLHFYVDMVDAAAFHSNVIAYPAIFVIGREKSGRLRVARRPEISKKALNLLKQELLNQNDPTKSGSVSEILQITNGNQPWILEASEQLNLVRRLEREYPTIEEVGCRVGIGVATGADRVFIGQFDEIDVEDDRKLPLVMTGDIQTGVVRWQGLGVINPFSDSGGLVDLSYFPRLRKYFDNHKQALMTRHVSRKSPANWYRTIDRIYPELATTPKLLIPDIKGEAQIVFENGRFYPHHNLYFVTSQEWELQALRVILMSGIARLFVSAYSTRMRGGYLRFQAQYLRRIRIPRRSNVPNATIKILTDAFTDYDIETCIRTVADLYRLSSEERTIIEEGFNTHEPGNS